MRGLILTGAIAAILATLAGCTAQARAERVATTQGADTSAGWTYGYEADGTLSSVSGASGARTTTTTPAAITAGGVTYTRDALGRVVARGATTFTYGPDGALASSSSSGGDADYITDETGARLAKKQNGTFSAAWVEGVVLSGSDVIEPVKIAGKVMGELRNGVFASTVTDARGTIVAGTDGVTNLASPYGERAIHPDVAVAIDYAEKAWDADAATIRMGVRDYDPYLGRFLTADPLFLGNPGKCVDRPYECNLFGYAAGDPLDFVDPDGTETRLVATINPNNLKGVMQLIGDDGGVLWQSGTTNRTKATQKNYENRLPPLAKIEPRVSGSNLPLAPGTYTIGPKVVFGSSKQFPSGALEIRQHDGSDQGVRIHSDYDKSPNAMASVLKDIASGGRPDWDVGTKGCFRIGQSELKDLMGLVQQEMPKSITVNYDTSAKPPTSGGLVNSPASESTPAPAEKNP